METPMRISPSFLLLVEELELPEEPELADELEPDDDDELPEESFLEQPVNDRPSTARDNKIPKIFFINPPV
jgi:hypothetical protein